MFGPCANCLLSHTYSFMEGGEDETDFLFNEMQTAESGGDLIQSTKKKKRLA